MIIIIVVVNNIYNIKICRSCKNIIFEIHVILIKK